MLHWKTRLAPLVFVIVLALSAFGGFAEPLGFFWD